MRYAITITRFWWGRWWDSMVFLLILGGAFFRQTHSNLFAMECSGRSEKLGTAKCAAPFPQDQMQQNLSKEAALAWSLIRHAFGMYLSWASEIGSFKLSHLYVHYFLDSTCSKVRQSSPLTMTVLSRKLVLLTRRCRHHDSCGDCELVILLSLCHSVLVCL
jgi:hypothetical protein